MDKRGLPLLVVASLLIPSCFGDGGTPTPAAASCPSGWSAYPSPSHKTVNALSAVTMMSRDDGWAVGNTNSGPGHVPQPEGPTALGPPSPLIEHWDGRAWGVSSGPVVQGELDLVAAHGPRDIWAVGTRSSGVAQVHARVLIEHFDGTTWRLVRAPRLGDTDTHVADAIAISSRDAWILGYGVESNGGYRPFVLRWNGRAWRRGAAPNAREGTYLNGIDALGPSDVWIAGSYQPHPGDQDQTYVVRYDGHRWRRVPSPNDGVVNARSTLNAIDMVSPTEGWAMGDRVGKRPGASLSLIERWDGARWSVVPSPNHGGDTSLRAVSAVSSTDVWAAGFGPAPGQDEDLSIVEHWNGSRWTLASPCQFGPQQSQLLDVATTPSGEAWFVGYLDDSTRTRYHNEALTERAI